MFLMFCFSRRLKVNSGSNFDDLYEITGIPKKRDGIKTSNNPPIQAQSAGVQKQSVTGVLEVRNS